MELESDTDLVFELEDESETDFDLELELESDTDLVFELEAESDTDLDFELEDESETDFDLESDCESDDDLEIESESDSDLLLLVETESFSEVLVDRFMLDSLFAEMVSVIFEIVSADSTVVSVVLFRPESDELFPDVPVLLESRFEVSVPPPVSLVSDSLV